MQRLLRLGLFGLLLLARLSAGEALPAVGFADMQRLSLSAGFLIDSRTAEAFAAGHLPGALSIAAADLAQRLPTDHTIPITIAGDGTAADRSVSVAAERLRGLGYRRLSRYPGGFREWISRRQPIDVLAQPIPVGAVYHDGTAYLLSAPTGAVTSKPGLLVWCHPSDGNPAEEFTWWREQALCTRRDPTVVLLAPQARGLQFSPERDGPRIAALIERIVADHGIDPRAVVLGGHSAGGFFAYDWGLIQQQRFVALVAAAARHTRQPPPPAAAAGPRILIYHSRNDQVIPWARMEETRGILARLGYQPELAEDSMQHSIGPRLATAVDRLFTSLLAR